MQSGIYEIKNIRTGDLYIGSSCRLHIRKKEHFRLASAGAHHSIIFQRAWDKYSESDFEFIILENCDKARLLEREQLYLDWLSPKYNISLKAGQPPPPTNKPILRINIDTGERKEYRVRDDVILDGFNEGEVTACCLGRAGSHLGFYWKFVDGSSPDFINNHRACPVIRVDGNNSKKRYTSFTEAGKDGYSVSSISACCLGKLKTHAGFR